MGKLHKIGFNDFFILTSKTDTTALLEILFLTVMKLLLKI